MANVPVPYYYNQMSTKERSYIDYMGELNKNIGSTIESASKEISSSIVDAQIATSNAIYNNTQELKGTLTAGFSDVSRELGVMGSNMSMGFAGLNNAVQQSSEAICRKLDEINNTLKNPLYTESRELYNRAAQNYIKGLYEEALEDLREAIKKNKTDTFSHFLMGQTLLYGISEFSNVINLDDAIEAFKNAAKYISHDAKTHDEARLIAAEIWFYLGLACHAKANDELHNSNKEEYQKQLDEAKMAYSRSWEYSQGMLETLYNLARCKTLSGDAEGAIQDLMTVILKDHGYCIKVFLESDFNNEFKDKLFSQLKRKVYPEAKASFDSIESIKAKFNGSYSSELDKLIKMYPLDTLTKDMPPFDMLMLNDNIQKILPVLEREYKNNEARRRAFKLQNCIYASGGHTVGLKADGTVVAVGRNDDGQCNTKSWRDIVAVSTRGSHTVGLKADGTVVAVGRNDEYEEYNTQDWQDIVAVSTGYSHIVGLKADGTVVAVGENKYGQCNIQGWRDIVAVSADSWLTIGLKADGTVVAVGRNEYGECNTKSWRDIIAVSGYTVGLKADGTVVAVGRNEYGKCNIQGWRDIIAVSTGYSYIVGLKADGTVVAVGRNEYGECNTQDWQDIVAVSSADYHTVGLKADGTVVAVGRNEYGKCNTQDWQDIVAVFASVNHTVGLKANGTVIAVGLNDKGQCNTQDWRNIGCPSEELCLKWKQESTEEKRIKNERQQKEEQRRIEQSNKWASEGLCRYCGGKLGLLSKECKSCGKHK